MSEPLLSVCLITYNHVKYIGEAIDGVLMQKFSFSWELIIADDCSTDGTREIILNYKEKHPEFIKLILQEKNVGSAQNWMDLITSPKSKYISYFEGDDYWTDPYKLQKQVDFLEANNDYGLVHHEADYLFEKNKTLIKNHHKTNQIVASNGSVFEELLKNNNIYTPSVVFRTSLFHHFTNIDKMDRNNFLMGDYVMWLAFAPHCKFHYIPQSMAVYRVIDGSASKSVTYEKAMLFLNSYFDIKLYFLKKYPVKSVTEKEIEQSRISMSISTAIKHKQTKEARKFAAMLNTNDWKNVLKRILIFSPVLFRYIQRKNKL